MERKAEHCPISETRHASCVARDGKAVLLLGRSGAGKSDLALRLIDRGFRLVADDRVRLDGVMASPPLALRDLLEVRDLGILRVRAVFPVPVALVVVLDEPARRLPDPERDLVLHVPLLRLPAWHVSTPLKVEIALGCITGAHGLHAGFLVTDLQQTHGGCVTET